MPEYMTPRLKPKKNPVRVGIGLLVLSIILFLTLQKIFLALPLKSMSNSLGIISPLGSDSVDNTTPTPDQPITPLGKVVQASLNGTTGTYGIVIKNLKTNESYSFNEHKVFLSGSLYKLWVMALSYKQIQAKTLLPDEILSEDIVTLNKDFYIDPDLAEETEGNITLSVTQALHQMIVISHNYAALLLTKKIGLSKVAAFLSGNGFTESQVGTHGDAPKTTAFDIALFYQKLYNYQLADQEHTKEMLDLLKAQQLNDKIPKYLPDSIDSAHKTGELGQFNHDAGIIFSPKGNYIIVVLSETNNPAAAKERIAKISEGVYNYFTK